MTIDLEKAFKAKLRALAKEQKRDPADLWQNLMLERFLIRLAQSQYCNHFILKGASLLSKYIDIGRETRDLDFLARDIGNDINHLKTIFENIAKIDLKDGFVFQRIQIVELRHPHMSYSGAEVSMICYFGKTRSKVAVDVGFGDIVDPVTKQIPLMHSSKGSLFERSIKLNCYPKEFIFAEKLETLVFRGAFNSRMKDFHDLFSLIKYSNSQPFQNLGKIVRAVFDHRKTPFILPINYSEDEMSHLQTFWMGYLRRIKVSDTQNLPTDITEILLYINDYLSGFFSA